MLGNFWPAITTIPCARSPHTTPELDEWISMAAFPLIAKPAHTSPQSFATSTVAKPTQHAPLAPGRSWPTTILLRAPRLLSLRMATDTRGSKAAHHHFDRGRGARHPHYSSGALLQEV